MSKVFKKKKVSQSFKKTWDSLCVEKVIQKELKVIVEKDESLDGVPLVFDYESHPDLYNEEINNVVVFFASYNLSLESIRGTVSFPIQKSQLIPLTEGIKQYLHSLGFGYLNFLFRASDSDEGTNVFIGN